MHRHRPITNKFVVTITTDVFNPTPDDLRKALREGIQDYMQDRNLMGKVDIMVTAGESLGKLLTQA